MVTKKKRSAIFSGKLRKKSTSESPTYMNYLSPEDDDDYDPQAHLRAIVRMVLVFLGMALAAILGGWTNHLTEQQNRCDAVGGEYTLTFHGFKCLDIDVKKDTNGEDHNR